MNSLLIDKYVIELFEKNGWYKGRMFDISFWINELSKEGYICFDYAIEILEELGGIEVNVGNCNGYEGAIFDFNPYNAASGEYDRIERFEILAGEKLYPIGSMGQAIAYVGDKQNIYFGDWKTFYWHGKSVEDYLNRLFKMDCKPIQII